MTSRQTVTPRWARAVGILHTLTVFAVVLVGAPTTAPGATPAPHPGQSSERAGDRVRDIGSVTFAVQPAGPAGRFGYAANGRLLSVIDAANPAIVARLPLGDAATGALAADPGGTAVYVATNSYIAKVDTRSRAVVATVPVAAVDQLLMHPSDSYLYASTSTRSEGVREYLVVVVDTRTNAVIASVALPGWIKSMTVLPDGRKVYIATVPGGISALDTLTQRVTAEIPIGGGPITADPAGRWVYAVSAEGIAVIDAATDTVSTSIPIPNETFWPVVASEITFDPGGEFAYVAAYTSGQFFGGYDGRVVVIDAATYDIAATITLNQVPTAIVVDPSGSRIYVSGQTPGSPARPTQLLPAGVAAIDAATRSVVATIAPVSPEPYIVRPGSLALNAATEAVYAMDSETAYVIDAATNRISATLPFGADDPQPSAVRAFAPDPPSPSGALVHYLLGSGTNTFTALQPGAPGDSAVAADYDGDGRADVAVLRPREGTEEAVWYVKRSGDGGVVRRQWGATSLGDVAVPADYDGDGRADIAVWRPAEGGWYVLRSSDRVVEYWRFGHSTDLPVPADYDGDGRADLATYGAGTWLVFGSIVGVTTREFGFEFRHPSTRRL